jgi:hypothetical protein
LRRFSWKISAYLPLSEIKIGQGFKTRQYPLKTYIMNPICIELDYLKDKGPSKINKKNLIN